MALTYEDAETALADESDEDLVRRAQGNPDEFGALYLRYARPVHAFILPRVDRNEAVAQDLTSQVFSRAFSALPSYRPGIFRAWLYSIARNAVIDHYRRQRGAVPLEAAAGIATNEPGLDERAVAEDARRRLHAALTRLAPNQRQIVELRLLGLTGAEIAGRLDLHPDAVKSAQYRAFARLRDILGENPSADSTRTQRGRS
jgi:RNA polymerase sigma factor (sigma-70 family)